MEPGDRRLDSGVERGNGRLACPIEMKRALTQRSFLLIYSAFSQFTAGAAPRGRRSTNLPDCNSRVYPAKKCVPPDRQSQPESNRLLARLLRRRLQFRPLSWPRYGHFLPGRGFAGHCHRYKLRSSRRKHCVLVNQAVRCRCLFYPGWNRPVCGQILNFPDVTSRYHCENFSMILFTCTNCVCPQRESLIKSERMFYR